MTYDALKVRFPNATEQFLRANSDDALTDSGMRKHPTIQGTKADRLPKERNAANADNRPRSKKSNGSSKPRYRITIALRFSDRHRRDPDGCAATILDALVSAGRRMGIHP